MRKFTQILIPVLLLCFSFINNAIAQVPGNDLICNATVLSVGLGCTQGTNVNATATGSPVAATCWNPASTSNDVWYSFVATTTNMTVSTDFTGLTLNNTQIALYSSSTNNCTGTLTLVACGENGGTNVTNNSITDVSLVVGNTYFIRVDGNGTATGTFCVSIYDTYTPGSTPCEAQVVNPNNSGCSNLNGNLATNSTVPNASYPALGVDYGGCDNETAQVGAWTTFVANSASVTLTNSSGGARDYTFFTGTCDNLQWISCTPNVANNGTTIFTGLTNGANYYILTTLTNGATTATVNTTHCLTNTVPCTPPTNDNCSNAMAVTAGVLYTVTNYCASADQPPALCSGTLQNNIWFTWTTPANWTGQAFFQLFQENCANGATTQGMQCSVYTAGVVCGSAANCVATSNTVTDNNVNIVWTPVPGSTYLINYDGYSGEVCHMNFEITNTASVVVVSVNSATICQGDSVVLTATSNATGYTWSTGQTGSSITVSPSVTTSYTVSATAGGTGSAVSTVVVNPIPSPPTAGSNSAICAGSTLNLTASNIGNATYSWTGPNGFTSAQQNPTIPNATAAAAGTYFVSVSVLNCPSTPDSTVVVINPIPDAPTAASNTPVCNGGTIDLTASTVTGATSYNWTGPNGFTSNLQNPSIPNATGAASGTYSVTSSALGCTGTAGTTTVTVSAVPAAPQAGSNAPLCEGSTLNLFAGTIAGATYSWTGPNGFTSTAQNPSVTNATAADAGTYSVIATISGCISNAGTTNVVINPIPAAPTLGSNSPICEGGVINLTSTSVAGATYSWTGPNGFTSNQQNPTINNTQSAASGAYTLVVTVAGCSSTAAVIDVIVNKIPAPVANSNSPICEGATLDLTATTFGSATYSWTGPNGFTSNVQNPTIPNATAAASGVYSVSVISNGCPSAQPGTVTVVVNPTTAPTAANNGPLCSGADLNLTASTILGATYTWTGPNGFTSTLQNPTITGVTTAEAGTYSVVANVSGCNSSSPATTTVVVNPIPTVIAGSNSPICTGSTINLTATTFAGATYAWSGPNGFTSNLQNPSIPNATTAASGTYSVQTAASGCASSAPATTTVTVNAIPTTPVAGSNSPLCVGSTLNLTASTIAGATYSWTGPNGFVSNQQNPSLPNVTLASAGVYSVNVGITGCNSPTAVANVVVHPIPAAPVASSNSPVCQGFDVNLSASTVAGATYSWTGPNGYTSNLQNPTITAAQVSDAGDYSVVATVSGCTSDAATTTVVVNALPPAPVAGSNSPVCIGDTLFLTASFIQGATYLWTDLIGFTSTEQNPVVPNVTLLAGSTYTVVATVNGCTGPGAQVTVVVVPRPVASFSSTAPVCLGAPVDFSNTGSTGVGYTFAWDFGPDATPSTSTLENPTGILYSTGGTKTVTLTIGNGTCETSVTQTITITGTPFANFTNDGPACFPPGIITFTDASTGNVTSWQWDFGPGASPATANVQGPIAVTYATSGTKSVMLTVSGGGCSNTTTLPVDVGVVGADFTSSVPQNGDNGCLGQGVNFYNIGSSGSNAQHFWNFGAGATPATSTDENPAGVVYATTGAKIVTHTVTVGACGLTATVQHIITINPVPVTSFTSTAPVCATTAVDFTNTGSTGVNYSFFWDFGSGATPSTSIAENPAGVNYSTSGTKTVTLSITNEFYCVVQVTQNIIIKSTPSASFTSNAPQCTTLPVDFTNTGTLSGVTWAWDFGSDANPTISNAQNPTGVTYAIPGIKTVSLTTTDNVSGCSATAASSITINMTPYASFTTNAPQCSNVGFNFTNTGSTGGSWAYTWNFGAGANPAISSAENPAGVLYGTPGTKTVTFTVTGQGGCTQTNTQTIQVDAAPTASFTSTAPQCTGLNVDFTNTGTTTGVTYAWDFGPGATPSTSTDQNPAGVVYSTAGSKIVTLVVTAPSGCTATATNTININLTPDASFTSNAPQCSTTPIDFTNTGSTGGAWSYDWSFGVGASPASSSAENPTGITYSSSGTKTISFTVSGGGCTHTATQTIVINSTPTASFISTAPQCTGLPVNFANTGTGTGVTWAWDFGQGATPATSSAQYPSNVVYSTAGLKGVTLTITDSASGCSVIATNTFNIFQSPTATFTSTAPQCSTVAIDFTNTGSTGGNWSYAWNLGQGAIPAFSSAESPSGILYSTSGTKTVTFTISDNHCTQTATQNIVISQTPTASFTSTAPQCTGSAVDFTNTGTTTGVSYAWDFGAGATPATSTSQNPFGVTYSTAGTKTVTLTTTDLGSGCSVTATNTYTIHLSPVATFTSTAPQCSTVGIDFTNTGSTGGNWSYAWNLGQGAIPSFSSAENPTGILYGTAGTKTVTFTVSDQFCNQTAVQQIVINATPAAGFVSTAPQCTGLGVDFNNTGTQSGVSWAWDFGAGATPATGTDLSPSGIVYSTGGIKTVTLTTTDVNSGCSVTATNNITIYQTPTATFTSNAPQCATVGINFTNTGSTGSNWSYSWNFGESAAPAVSAAENPTGVMYGTSGVKVVTFTIADQHCTQTSTQSITVQPTPTVGFTSTAPECTGLPIAFTNTGSSTGVTWAWNFGQGATPATSTDQNPTGVVYSTAGTKSVTLTTTDAGSGCSVTVTTTINIHLTPTASFTSNAPQCAGVGIDFTNTGSNGSNWSYSWNFGPGASPATSAGQNPTGILYSSGGTKTVTFTVSDQNCTQTATQDITINETPVANFTSTAPQCTGLPVNFTNTGTSTGVSWAWDFGTGASPGTDIVENPSGVVYSTAGIKTVTFTITNIATSCAVTATTTINIFQTPTATFTSTAPQCARTPVNFTNTGSTGSNWSFTWDLGTDAVPATSVSENPGGVLYSSSGTKTITFTISDANCTQTSTQTINVNPLPYAEAGADTTICANRNVTLGNDSVIAGATYNWFPSNTLDNPFSANPVAAPTAAVTVYSVTVTAPGTGCQNSDFVTVTMLPPLHADAGPDVEICLNDSIQIGAGFIEGQFYDWSPSTGLNNVSSSNPVAHPTQTTTYTVVVSDTAGCTPITDNVTITVHSLPSANAGPDDTITQGGSIQLIGTGGVQYYWTPGSGLSNANLFNPIASPDTTTNYVLTVTDLFGCQNTDTVRITVIDFAQPWWIPSAFTPDGNGHNDVLYVRGGGFLTYEFAIYNRYGELLFLSHNISEGWDGTSRLDGNDTPPDAYVWKLTGVLNSGAKVDAKGLVNLVK